VAFIAKKCVQPISSWVYQWILGCNGEFAVQFMQHVHRSRGVALGGVPGVTCWYPGAPASFFDVALVYPGPGKFVHHFLYKRLPYTLIKDPCPPADCGQLTTCCPGVFIPNTLYATISNRTGNLTTLPDTIVITWDAGQGQWIASGGTLCIFRCLGVWQLRISAIPFTPASTVVCTPLAITFSVSQVGGTATVTITP
jgi:hypothetical protein